MYKNLALINGVLLAIMVFLNGMLSSITGPYMSTFIFHVLGFILILMISIAKKNTLSNLKELPLMFFLPGVLSVITILLNNICIPQIGITLTIGVSLYGQLVMSSLVEHFGLFGMPVNRFRKEKILGFSIISLGIIVMITM
ncbi:transporter family-2 protein [Anaerosolibacter carboniphilus]|uniref:Transporter family-2 protein n=1 Tax=Anaerosolibacter carboniphilus TaxID=1417629 RepID=A0A841KK49_9FIRM|nr:DMT family transporter [Anaerosolibacter carboniphilus]MBB6214244.1 transporter family-2 protein [Anaerosolibacter carboniphilus]